MTEKRFTINNSNIVQDGYFIKDNVGNFSFPTTIDGSDLIMYHKALNKLNDENEQLKQEMGDLGTIHAEEINKIENEFDDEILKLEKENEQLKERCIQFDFLKAENSHMKSVLEENEQLKQQIRDMSRFGGTGEHIRLSINIETGELQRHIYASGQWFGDFDRVLCENWISKEDYQKFIDRVIEVYNTEFKGDVE